MVPRWKVGVASASGEVSTSTQDGHDSLGGVQCRGRGVWCVVWACGVGVGVRERFVVWCVCGREGEVCGVCGREGEVCVCAWVARNCADYIFHNLFSLYSPLLRPHPPVSSR